MAELRRQQDAAANMTAIRDRFEFLSHEYPDEGSLWEPLREHVQALLDDGYPREVVLGALDDFRHVLRDSDREELEDDVIDVMGFMTGWCSSRMRI